MSGKRFELWSWDFSDMCGVLYDKSEKKELHLSLYKLVDLLNDVSQQEFDLKQFKDEIVSKLDEMVKE